ncbi:hypothetical protein PHYBOEH_010926 [Phytophthora boehmeriae]|uniref:RxLR effector protein n=1 Tax=Phytophthora boehmeriae TaxID=109152 RepID=A0A8T1VN37_9STRA|nr:hypothetical protein PHYBOEH_010926 [Phytophthora boehmeriae]
MRLYHSTLLLALLTNAVALLTAKGTNQIKGLAAASPSDRIDSRDELHRINSVKDSEERVNPLGGLLGTSEIKLVFKTEFNNIAPKIVAKTNRDVGDIPDAIWKNIDAIKAKLGIPVFTKLTEADAFRRSAKGQLFHEFFDEFMLKQVKVRVKDGRSIDFAKKELRIGKLVGEALKKSSSFTYYDHFHDENSERMDKIFDVHWRCHKVVRNGETVGRCTEGSYELQLLRQIHGHECTDVAAFKSSDNFKYYDKFMTMRVKGWLNSAKTTDNVKKLWGFNTLKGNFAPRKAATYDEFMTDEVAKMVKSGISFDDAKKELGLEKLTGEALKNHINSKYYDDFVALKKEAA